MFDYYSEQKIKFWSVKYLIEDDPKIISLYKEIIWYNQKNNKIDEKYLLIPGDKEAWIIWSDNYGTT